MKTLIVYSSKYGCAKECITELYCKLKGEVRTVDIGSAKAPSLKGFDNVIIGGSIYVGQLNKKLRTFMSKNESELLKKNLGLFIVCGFMDKAQETLKGAFPSKLINHAKSTQCFGGELNPDKMGFLHKKVVSVIAKETDITKIQIIPQNIASMAEAVNAFV
jgi:menaquinone-dependent protoporphyrinogen oxidase